MSQQHLASTVKSLDKIAKELLKAYPDKHIFAFYGNMGAGKTTFIKSICKALGVKDEISSPSYSLINEYAGKKPIYHIDLYRLEDIDEAFNIGIEDYIFGENYCLIEWPNIIESILPKNIIKVKIETQDKNNRIITF